MTTKLKTKKYISKKCLLDLAIDIILLIALFGVMVGSSLYLYRGWSIVAAFLGMRFAIIFIISCVGVMFCLLYTSVTNLVVNMSLIRRTVFYESEMEEVKKHESKL